jgi:hypothetical protein
MTRLTSGLEGRTVKLRHVVQRSAATALIVAGVVPGCSPHQSAGPATASSSPTPLVAPPPMAPGPPPAGCPVPAGTASGMSAPPTGLVAFAIYQKGKVPFPEQVFNDPLVSGVDLAVRWAALEPAPNTFDWSALDCLFAQADSHHKFVALAVIPALRVRRGYCSCPVCRRRASSSHTSPTTFHPDRCPCRGTSHICTPGSHFCVSSLAATPTARRFA